MPPTRQKVTIDGNEAAAYIAYHTNEVIAIYPITPASPMGELADEWAAKGKQNIWGSVPTVIEMQSEAARRERFTAPSKPGRWAQPLPPRKACC